MNKTVLITRAQHQSAELITHLSQRGIDGIVFPCVDILPPSSPQILAAALNHLDEFDRCIFTSANAVAAIPENVTEFKKVYAIGPTTAQALAERGIHAAVPQQFNSEGLLAMPEFMQVEQQRIGIFTGEKPRGLLHDELQQRGAHVELIFCYRRSCPQYTQAELNEVMAAHIDAIICTSAEVLVNLITLFEENLPWLTRHSLIVVSDVMYKLATEIGFREVKQADNATVSAILTLL